MNIRQVAKYKVLKTINISASGISLSNINYVKPASQPPVPTTPSPGEIPGTFKRSERGQGVPRQPATPPRQEPAAEIRDPIHLWVFYHQSVLPIKRFRMMWQAPSS